MPGEGCAMATEQAPVIRNARTGIAEKDHTEPHFSLDFKAWIKEQQQEIEDLKRAARGFSPSNSTSQGHDLSARRSYDGDLVIGNIDGDGPESLTALISEIPPPMSPLPPPAQPQHNALRADTRDSSGEKSLAYDNANDRSGGHGSIATLAPPYCNRMMSSVVPGVSAYGASPAVARFIEGSSTSRRTAWRNSTRCGGDSERDLNEKASPCLQHEEFPRAWHSPDDAHSAPSPRNIHDRFNIGSRSSVERRYAVTEDMRKRQETRAGRETYAAEGRGSSTRTRCATAVAGVPWQGMAEEAEASWWAVDEEDVVPSHAECRKSYRETSTGGGAHVATRTEKSKAVLTGSSNSVASRPVWEGSKRADSALAGGHWQISGETDVVRCSDRFLVHSNRVVEGSRLDSSGFGSNTCFRDLAGSRGAVKDSNIETAKLEDSGFSLKERARATMPLDASCLETARMEPLPREGLARTRMKLAAADSSTTLPANFSSYPRCSNKKGSLPSTAFSESREDLQPSQRAVLGGGSIDGSVFAGAWSLGMKGSRGKRSIHSGAEGKSASLADSLAARREEQSVLARQLERELASTISVLREERRQRRVETEAFRSRLEEAKATVLEREVELERRGIMMKSIVSELEALQTRCDRLTASREKRTEEVEKAMGRLREDNRELQDRLRWAEAAAIEARAERDDARAEMERISKDLLSAKALATVAEHRAEEAEAALSKVTESAELHQKTLERSEEERECLRQEVEGLRKRLEQEGREGMVTSLKTQVENLEDELVAANRRYKALEARLDMSREELTGEGGEGRRRPVEGGFDRDEPGRVDAVSCDVKKQKLFGLDRLSARKENIAGRHDEGGEGNIDANGVNISVRGHGDRFTTVAKDTMDEYEELNVSRTKLALFPSGGCNRDAMGATSGDSARSSLLGSAGDHGVDSRPHGLKLLKETLEKFNRASGEKGHIAIDARVERQAIAGMTSNQSGGKGVEPGRGIVAECGADQGVEGKDEGREDARNAVRRGGKIVYPRDSVLTCETEVDQREKQGNCDNRRAAERSISSTYRRGREGPAFEGFDENVMADPGDFRGAPGEIMINKGSNSSCGSSSSPYREMLEYQSRRGAGVIRDRTEDAAVGRPQTPAPNSMRPSTFTPERFERICETRQDARRGLGISARQKGSFRGDGKEIMPSRRRKLQVHVPMAQKAQVSKLQTLNAISDEFTTSKKAQQNMTIPARRRVSRATTDSNIIDRARNALANSRSTTVSVKRRSLGSSRASKVVSATGVGIRNRARVLSRTSIAPASVKGPRRLRSATLASSVQQQNQPHKARVVQPRGREKAESGGTRVFGGPGICEGGERGGDGVIGRPQRDRDRNVRSARVKTAPTSLRSETSARNGNAHKMGPTGSGRSKAPASTAGMSNVPMASSSVASGSVRSTKLARESVSLMRKRRERAGMKSSGVSSISGGVSSNMEGSSGVSGRNASGNRSRDAGIVARRYGGVARGKALVSSSGSKAWRP